MHLKKTTLLVIASLLMAPAFANDIPVSSDPQKDVNITVMVKKRKTPDETFQNKKLFVKFDKSTRLSTLVANKLKEKGYEVVDTEDAAEEVINIFGKFRFNNSEIDSKVRDFADLDPQGEINTQKADNEVTVPLSHVAMAVAVTGISGISVSHFTTWLSQITGVSGAINKFLTGDARGFCTHEDCYKTEQSAMLLIMSKSLSFDVLAKEKHEQIIINQVVDKVLSAGIDCFPDKANSQTK